MGSAPFDVSLQFSRLEEGVQAIREMWQGHCPPFHTICIFLCLCPPLTFSPDEECISQSSPGKQNRQTDRTEIDVGYKELAHTITGAEKSHAPLSVSWHPRRAVVRVQSYLKV